MLQAILLEFFERDLLKLREEIGLYPKESDLWEIGSGISNSAGNLCLHLVGNLQHFIGAVLDNTGFVRQRDAEFSLKNIPRSKLILSIDETIIMLKKALQNYTDADFEKVYPLEKHGRVVTTKYMLLHLLTHLNYHLGQVNYHRRLLTGS